MDWKEDRRFVIKWTLVFLVLGVLGLSFHELWRDELHHWKIIVDSRSFLDIVQNLRFDGHPSLWHFLLFPFSRLTSAPVAMQVFHLLLAACSVFIFLLQAPFSRPLKALFVLGYFPLYEYCVISRNYVLGFLLFFLFCALYPRRHTHFPLLAVLLALAANTSAHALILVLAVSAGLIWEHFFQGGLIAKKKLAIGLLIILCGSLLSVLTMMPPSDSGNVIEWVFALDGGRLQKTWNTLIRAYLPLPNPTLHYWNSNLILDYGWPAVVPILLGGFFVFFGVILLRKNPPALIIYVTGTLGLLAFFYTKYLGYARHHGFLFLLFVISLWLGMVSQGRGERVLSHGHPQGSSVGWTGVVLTILFSVHAAGGLAALGMDIRFPFSQARKAAGFIEAKGLKDIPIVGDIDFACASVAVFLKKNIYFPRGRRWGAYVVWDDNRLVPPRVNEIIETARRLSLKYKKDSLIVLNLPIPEEVMNYTILKKIGQTRPAVVEDEVFFFYLLPYSEKLAETLVRDIFPFEVPRAPASEKEEEANEDI